MNSNNITQYTTVQEKELEDIQSKGYLLRHNKSGARVVVIENEDENKVFAIGFRTPPEDSTGLPHILEHSVLCGSKNFPLKDPFVELAKGSLNTFLNAMTYPDKTVYPVASCNEKDFQNLMHVYMDAVLYPNIYEYEEIFRQEGWNYKLENVDADLEYNGVVYNEMKGAFSSPDGVLDRMILNALFPDTAYANESGGDPEFIPDLTYEQFLDFHATYYHPSNSYIYLYGNADMEEKLQWLDETYLSNFDEKQIDSQIEFQEPFAAMVEKEVKYSIVSNESEEDNTYLSWNKVIGSALDKKLVTAFEVLDYALLSAPGAPLKKALIDAKIGKDVLGSFDDGVYQPFFTIVAKNANLEQKAMFIETIEKTLKDLVEHGINKTSLEAGLNYIEFHFREADFGRYPTGLMYGLNLFDSWLYDDMQPFNAIEILDIFAELKQSISSGYFESLIQQYLLDNTHGAIVVVSPEKGRTARLDNELREKLQAYKAGLSEVERDALVEGTKQLENYQDTPSSEEAVKTLPVLKREDISKEVAPIYNEEMQVDGTTVLYHGVETNGIGYLDFLFDVKNVPTELIPYLGILQAALGMMDTANYEYGELFNEINVHTGGIYSNLEIYPDVTAIQDKKYKATLDIKAKALYEKLPKAVEFMMEMLSSTKFEDKKRLKEILDMMKSRMQAKFQSAGHTLAVARANSYHSVISKFKDMTNGISFYKFVCGLIDEFEEKSDEISDKIHLVASLVFNEKNMMISYTAGNDGKEVVQSLVSMMKTALYENNQNNHPYELAIKQKNEGFKTASKVQYVARTGNFVDKGIDYTGALQILRVVLSYEYLWQNVRVKGGAYGCMSGFNRIGEGYFTSYRDPNLRETMDIYEGVVEYLENFEASEEEITKFIIGAISSVDQPMTPATKGERSLNLHLNHINEEMLRKERMQILEATNADIRALSKVVKAILDERSICVIGSEEKIEQNKDLFDEIKDLF